jgi:hypothetical protein
MNFFSKLFKGNQDYYTLSFAAGTNNRHNRMLYGKFLSRKYYNLNKLIEKIVYHVHLHGRYYNSCLLVTKHEPNGLAIGYIDQSTFLLKSPEVIPLNTAVSDFYAGSGKLTDNISSNEYSDKRKTG